MFKTLIKIELAKQDKNQVWLSEQLGIAQPTLAKQMKNDDFKESRMREIAEALDCELVIKLVPKSTDS